MEPLEVNFYEQVEDELLKFAVIISKAKGKWGKPYLRRQNGN